jgi:hypothetical protein
MRFLVMVKATPESETGAPPDMEMLTEMGKFNDELMANGIMVMAEGLHPSSKGARVRFSGKDRSVIDGPFAEAKELVAGFWIWQCKSMEEAIEWVKRCPNPMNVESDIEIRPIFELDEFLDELPADVRAKEEKMRDELAKRKPQ